jgi:hypothetical protein
MKEEIIVQHGKKAYYMGVDLAYRLRWWQKVLVFFGFKNRWQDKSCSTVWKKNKDGTFEIVDINQF